MFSMDASTRSSDGQIVVIMRGELDVTGAAGAAGELSAIAALAGLVVVDLAGLEFIDSSGLAALVLVRKHAREAGGDLLLAAPQGQVLRFLTVTGLLELFGLYDYVAAASSAERHGASGPAAAYPALLATA